MATMLLSTSMPTPRARPEREMILRVTPVKCISTTAKSRLMGILSATMIVGRKSRRNSMRTMTASSAPNSRFSSTELMTRSMYWP